MLPLASRIVLVPVYLKYLTQRDFGIMSLNSTLSGTLIIFLSLGLDQAFVRYYFNYKHRENVLNAYVSTIFLTIAGFASAVTAGSLFFGDALHHLLFNDPTFTYIPFGVTAFLYAIANILNGVVLSYFRNRKDAVNYGILAGGSFVISTIAEFLAIVYFKLDVAGIIWVKILSLFAFSSIYWIYILGKTRLRYDHRFLKSSWRYSVWMILYVIMSSIFSSLDRILIANNFSMSTLAVYSLAMSISQFVEISIVSVQNTLYPSVYEMFKEDYTKRSAAINQIFRGMGLVILLVIAALTVATPVAIFNFIKHADYTGVVYVVPFIMVSFVFRYLYVTVSIPLFYFTSQAWRLFLLNAVLALVSLPLNFFLIPRVGLLGAAFANVAGRAAQVALTYYWAHQVSSFRFDFQRIKPLLIGMSLVLMAVAVFISQNRWGHLYTYIATSVPLVIMIGFVFYLFFVRQREIPLFEKHKHLRDII
ncbi:MAG: oligosaccharide flippase family protein [Chitinophagales bacterium]